MSSAAYQPRLRLVHDDEEHPSLSSRADAATLDPNERAVVKENRLAAHVGQLDKDMVDSRDPRWVLAMQTQARLQGAMLTPERREELMSSGKRLGLRPFESNLVIAVVQDHARREQPLHLADHTIGVIGIKQTKRTALKATRDDDSATRWLIAAAGGAIALAAVIIRCLLESQ